MFRCGGGKSWVIDMCSVELSEGEIVLVPSFGIAVAPGYVEFILPLGMGGGVGIGESIWPVTFGDGNGDDGGRWLGGWVINTLWLEVGGLVLWDESYFAYLMSSLFTERPSLEVGF
jgi:hypothetical protein